jgi:hypothetical protein
MIFIDLPDGCFYGVCTWNTVPVSEQKKTLNNRVIEHRIIKQKQMKQKKKQKKMNGR